MTVAQMPIEKPTPEQIARLREQFFEAYQLLRELEAEKKNTVSGYNENIREQREYLATIERQIDEAQAALLT